MSCKTADLCDQYPEQVKILTWPVRSFGGKQEIAGQIVTLQVDACNQAIINYLEQPGYGRILVVENIASEPNAITGDRLAKMAIDNQWQGLVILGNIRDSEVIASLPVGVWACGTYPMRGKSGRPFKDNIAIKSGEITMTSGDWLYADQDGIVLSKQKLQDVS